MSESLPLFPLGAVLFPDMLLPLHVFEDRYRRLMADRQGQDPIFGVVLTRRGREVADRPQLHAVGTAARLAGAGRYPDGRYDLVVRGGRRFRIDGGDCDRSYFTGLVSWLDEPLGDADGDQRLSGVVVQLASAYDSYLAALERMAGVEIGREELGDEPTALGYAICARMQLDNRTRQDLLETATTRARLERLLQVVRHERDLLLTTGIGGGVDHPGARILPN